MLHFFEGRYSVRRSPSGAILSLSLTKEKKTAHKLVIEVGQYLPRGKSKRKMSSLTLYLLSDPPTKASTNFFLNTILVDFFFVQNYKKMST